MVEQDQHAVYILESLKDIYEAEDCFLSDITLVVGQDKLKAHKLILATQSDFFKGLFRNEKKDEVTIDICSHSTLSTILKYFYTGRSEITIENVQDLLVAANFLQVKELIRKCSDFMARNLDLTNCVTVLRLGDLLNNEFLLQECINYIGDHFQHLYNSSEDLKHLPVDLFAKCIKSDRIILFSTYGTVLPAIQREDALVRVIVDYVRSYETEKRLKDTWPLFRALKLPFIAHHLDFKDFGLPELANFDDDPTVHSLIRSSRVQKEDDLKRKFSVDPFSKHNSKLRAYSIKYVIWSDRFGCGPNCNYREIRPFSCEGGTDKFITDLEFIFRPWENKIILGGLKVNWSNGSTDIAGITSKTAEAAVAEGASALTAPAAERSAAAADDTTTEADKESPYKVFSVNLREGENIQKVGLRSGWFIDRIRLTTNKGDVHGPWGNDGGEARKTQSLLRRNVDPKYVYLDGIRGYVVQAEGKPALNRISFKWAFFLDRKISKHSYYNSIFINEDNARISVAELETEINLTLSEEKNGRKRILPSSMLYRAIPDMESMAFTEDEEFAFSNSDYEVEMEEPVLLLPREDHEEDHFMY